MDLCTNATFTHIRLQKRRIDRCAISDVRQQTWQETKSRNGQNHQLVKTSAGARYRSCFPDTAQAIRASLFAKATITTF